MDLNAHRVTKTYFWETPLFVNEAQSPVQKTNLVGFPCEYTHVYLYRYTWYDDMY